MSWGHCMYLHKNSISGSFFCFVCIPGVPFAYSCIYRHCLRSMRSRVYETVSCPDVRPSVCPIIRLSSSVWQVCCWAPCWQQISVDSSGRWRPVAMALGSKCGQCHVASRDDEAEYRLALFALLISYNRCLLHYTGMMQTLLEVPLPGNKPSFEQVIELCIHRCL